MNKEQLQAQFNQLLLQNGELSLNLKNGREQLAKLQLRQDMLIEELLGVNEALNKAQAEEDKNKLAEEAQ